MTMLLSLLRRCAGATFHQNMQGINSMKIYFKKIEEFMEDNAFNTADLAQKTGIWASTFWRMKQRGTASAHVVRTVNAALGLKIQKRPARQKSAKQTAA